MSTAAVQASAAADRLEAAATRAEAAAEHYRRLWNQDNGLILAPLLVDGRLTGSWRLTGTGVGRHLEVTWFPGSRRPPRGELEEPVAALAAAYAVRVDDVTLTRG